MMYRNFGGGYSVPSHSYKKGGQALTCSPIRPTLMRGGQRWNNTFTKGGVING